MRWDVFLCYNRLDKQWIRSFAQFLRDLELKVFLDEDNLAFGYNIKFFLKKAIKNSQYLIFVISPESIESEWTEFETAIMQEEDPEAHEGRLIPLILRYPHDKDLPEYIQSRAYVDLRNQEKRKQYIKKLLKDIGITNYKNIEIPQNLIRGEKLHRKKLFPHDVFMSFAENDSNTVLPIIESLNQKAGLHVMTQKDWIAYQKDLEMISQSHFDIICLSPSYIKSPVSMEVVSQVVKLQKSHSSGKRYHVLPLLIDGDETLVKEHFPDFVDLYRSYNSNEDLGSIILSLPSKPSEQALKEWRVPFESKYNSKFYMKFPSWLTNERKEEIVGKLVSLIPALKEHRKKHLAKLQNQMNKDKYLADKSLPAWVQVSTTHSEKGYRLIVGFRNCTCEYRKSEELKLGCLNCGYYAGTGDFNKKAEVRELLQQVYAGFKEGFCFGATFDVIEFLNDGSFLNDSEFEDNVKKKIFSFLGKIPYVKRILVESTPEHLTSQYDEVPERLEQLGEHQHLEIGIGVETADEFIRRACINKGFNWDKFVETAEKIAEMRKLHNNKVSLVAYILVKPAFLTTSEIIEDTLKTLRELNKLSLRLKMPITPKLEPAVISDGTILSLLFLEGEKFSTFYSPLNYWTILEIITRAYKGAYEEDWCREVYDNIRIGAREDMTDVLKVPAIYEMDGTYDLFDFILYDAIQQFNQHHNIFKLYSTIKQTKPENIQHLIRKKTDSSLNRWINEDLLDQCQIVKFYKQYKNQINDPVHKVSESDVEFLNDTYEVLDMLEGHDMGWTQNSELKKIIDSCTRPLNEETKQKIGKILFQCFYLKERRFFDIHIKDAMKEPDGIYRLFFEALDFISKRKISIWSSIK